MGDYGAGRIGGAHLQPLIRAIGQPFPDSAPLHPGYGIAPLLMGVGGVAVFCGSGGRR